MTEQILISVILLTPIAGWLAAFAMSERRNYLLALTAGMTGAAAVALIAMIHANHGSASGISIGTWLTIPSVQDIVVNLSFQADQSRCVLVLAASLILICEIAGVTHPIKSDSPLSGLLYPLSMVAILASDLVVLSSVWILIDYCVIQSTTRECFSVSRDKRLNTSTILAGSGVLLLFATLMAMARFGTSNMTDLINRALDDGRVDSTTVVSGISVLFVSAAAIRCAFFPALIWPRTPVESRSSDAGITVVLAGLLPGISLAVTVFPLCNVASESFVFFGTLGVLTCFTATCVALMQTDSARMVTLLCVSAAGLAASASASGLLLSDQIAAHTLLAQLAAIFVLKRGRVGLRQRIGFVIALAVGISGFGGSNAILALTESALRENGDIANSGSADQFLIWMWWGVIASQFLWGIAIMKLVMNPSPGSLAQDTKQLPTGDSSIASTVVVMVAGIALGACLLPVNGVESATGIPARLLTFGVATPACLLGTVVTWLLTQSNENVRRRVATSLESLARPGREWFYLEQAIRYGVALPTRGLAMIAEVGDRKISGGAPEHGWKKTLVSLAEPINELRRQPALYYGLSGILLVIGMLWSLRR